VLELGLNFKPTPKCFDHITFLSSIESAIDKLKHVEKLEIRNSVSQILKTPTSFKQNLTFQQRFALNSLKNDKTITIVKADKGNATVILDTLSYISQIETILNNNTDTYLSLKKNPAPQIVSQLDVILKTISTDNSKFIPLHHKFYINREHVPPILFAQPKIHKVNNPLRFIVSSKHSPTNKLCKILLKILNATNYRPISHITSPHTLVSQLQNLQIKNSNNSPLSFCSFDVIDMYNKIPTDLALQSVKNNILVISCLQWLIWYLVITFLKNNVMNILFKTIK